MAAANHTPTPINELLWSATRYSDVLKIDRRVVAQALEKAPAIEHNGVRVWHVRDGMPAIFRLDAKKHDPATMAPKEALDYYRAQRERIKLAEDIRKMLPAADVEQTFGKACKAVAQFLDSLPDALERDCGLSPAAVTSAQLAIDTAREGFYHALMELLEARDG